MVPGRPNLGSILTKNGIITDEQLAEGLKYGQQNGVRLGRALMAIGACSDVEIAACLAEQMEIPFVDLYDTPPSPSAVSTIPAEIALEHGVLPVGMDGNKLLVAARDPFDIRMDEAVRNSTTRQVTIAIAPESQLQEMLKRYFEQEPAEPLPTPAAVDDVEELHSHEEKQMPLEKLVAAGEQVSTIRMVNALIADGVRRGASDIHIEPGDGSVRVRYRLDGRLRAAVSIPSSQLPSIVARVKIMSAMDISESRKPQDGGARIKIEGKPYELRTSTLPGIWGEVVVIRVLNHDPSLTKLDCLGFDPEMLRSLRRLLAQRQGMLLVTGPTGSGKTTTLYAALGHLNTEDVNIITVEDPVEIKLQGINQIQVHDRAGRSFAGALRSMLRQDPDIIMVGEIRDLETAEIASRAALTGHLVLSSLHTQDALGTLSRLFDMGVARYIVTASLNGAIAQRLLRRVCDHCAAPYDPPAGLKIALEAEFGSLKDARFRKGKGCAACNRTGNKGRVGVYELLVLDNELRQLLAEGALPEVVKEAAIRKGFRTMEQDAFDKACQGLVAPEAVVELGMNVALKLEETGGHEEDEPELIPLFAPIVESPNGHNGGGSLPELLEVAAPS